MKSEFVHISRIVVGDAVRHHGDILTVNKSDIKIGGGFESGTLFGDSYRCGTQLVEKFLITKTRLELIQENRIKIKSMLRKRKRDAKIAQLTRRINAETVDLDKHLRLCRAKTDFIIFGYFPHWISTDPDRDQWMMATKSNSVFTFREGDIDETIDLTKISHQSLVNTLSSYGYNWDGVNMFRDCFGDPVSNSIIAECVFEEGN